MLKWEGRLGDARYCDRFWGLAKVMVYRWGVNAVGRGVSANLSCRTRNGVETLWKAFLRVE
jgi:hypothetical protein